MNKDAFELLGSLADTNRERLRQDSKAAHEIKLIKKMTLKQLGCFSGTGQKIMVFIFRFGFD